MPRQGDISFDFKASVTRAAADLSDLPTPISGVITLLADIYEIKGALDLSGNRLVVPSGCEIRGSGSITSTGLGTLTPLISSTGNVLFKDFTVSGIGTVFDCNGSGNPQFQSLNVKFVNCTNIGTIKNYLYSTWFFNTYTNCGGLIYDGTIGSIQHISNGFIAGSSTTMISAPSTFTLSGRMIIDNCGFNIPSGSTGINISSSANLSVDSVYILATSFAGAGTYMTGVTSTDNKVVAYSCKGITNTGVYCAYYVSGNATPTTIAVAGTYVKASGTTVADITQKFDLTVAPNRGVYIGAVPVTVEWAALANISSGNNKTIRLKFAKNGTVVGTPPGQNTTSGTGDVNNMNTRAVTLLVTNDYVELWVTNATDTTNIVPIDYLVIGKQITN